MNLNFRLPHITGTTVPEQITQIISYLRQLATELQQLSDGAAQTQTLRSSDSGGSNRFWKLRVHKALIAEDHISVAGDINGVFLRSSSLARTKGFRLLSQYKNWDAPGNYQSFFLAGNIQDKPVQGVLIVTGTGEVQWSGTEGISVTAEDGGVVAVTPSSGVMDPFIIQSTKHFLVLK